MKPKKTRGDIATRFKVGNKGNRKARGRPRLDTPIKRAEAKALKQATVSARERIEAGMQRALDYAPAVIEQLARDATDEKLDAADRHRAAALLLDRAMGSDPQAAAAAFAGLHSDKPQLALIDATGNEGIVGLLNAILGRDRSSIGRNSGTLASDVTAHGRRLTSDGKPESERKPGER